MHFKNVAIGWLKPNAKLVKANWLNLLVKKSKIRTNPF